VQATAALPANRPSEHHQRCGEWIPTCGSGGGGVGRPRRWRQCKHRRTKRLHRDATRAVFATAASAAAWLYISSSTAVLTLPPSSARCVAGLLDVPVPPPSLLMGCRALPTPAVRRRSRRVTTVE
jgi:hypothetical protein